MNRKWKLFYLGSRPKEEETGGMKYMNEVVDYLQARCGLMSWDPIESQSMSDRVNKLNFKSIISQFKSNFWGIKKVREASKGDIIIINSYLRHRFFLCIIYARYFRGCRIIVFVNGIYHYLSSNEFYNLLDRIMTKNLLRSADLIIANSMYTRKEILKLCNGNSDVEVIYPRLEIPPRINLTKKRKRNLFRILFVGYCEPIKELDILIKAVGKMKYLDIGLEIIGDEKETEYVSMIEKLIRELGVEDKVKFHRRLEWHEVCLWYQIADLLVSPSRWEGYGRVLAEAMYFGLPVIGADKGASKELIDHGVNGFLFESGNDQSLASLILQLYEDKELRKKFGEKNRDLIKRRAKFHQNIGEQFYSILERQFC